MGGSRGRRPRIPGRGRGGAGSRLPRPVSLRCLGPATGGRAARGGEGPGTPPSVGRRSSPADSSDRCPVSMRSAPQGPGAGREGAPGSRSRARCPGALAHRVGWKAAPLTRLLFVSNLVSMVPRDSSYARAGTRSRRGATGPLQRSGRVSGCAVGAASRMRATAGSENCGARGARPGPWGAFCDAGPPRPGAPWPDARPSGAGGPGEPRRARPATRGGSGPGPGRLLGTLKGARAGVPAANAAAPTDGRGRSPAHDVRRAPGVPRCSSRSRSARQGVIPCPHVGATHARIPSRLAHIDVPPSDRQAAAISFSIRWGRRGPREGPQGLGRGYGGPSASAGRRFTA